MPNKVFQQKGTSKIQIILSYTMSLGIIENLNTKFPFEVKFRKKSDLGIRFLVLDYEKNQCYFLAPK